MVREKETIRIWLVNGNCATRGGRLLFAAVLRGGADT